MRQLQAIDFEDDFVNNRKKKPAKSDSERQDADKVVKQVAITNQAIVSPAAPNNCTSDLRQPESPDQENAGPTDKPTDAPGEG